MDYIRSLKLSVRNNVVLRLEPEQYVKPGRPFHLIARFASPAVAGSDKPRCSLDMPLMPDSGLCTASFRQALLAYCQPIESCQYGLQI